MSAYTTLARPYAKAAFEYAVEKNAVAEWSAFLELAGMIVADAVTQRFLVNPQIDVADKKQFIKELCGHISDEQNNFLELLASYHRLLIIPAIYLQFDEFLKIRNKIAEVEVVTAFPMSADQQKRLQKALQIRLQKDIKLNMVEDKTIIGGAIIRAGDFVIDSSSKNQLQRLYQVLEA